MAIIHISESEAARDFASLLARVRAGASVVIDDETAPVLVVRGAARPVRRLSESLHIAHEHGSTATLDSGFARDLEAVVASHPETIDDPWA
jgi:antitoxin (DNA-binding transcriptional repressor) of toxin-antitoxin stability system